MGHPFLLPQLLEKTFCFGRGFARLRRHDYLGGLLTGVSGLPSTLWTPVFVVCAVLW
jgi:hypothetical protein